jgi:hypothetical protein
LHIAMTGPDAKHDKRIGGAHTAWDGYIKGRTVELIPGKRTVQSCRTTQFTGEDPDSTITVELAPAKTGARMTLSHTGSPMGRRTMKNAAGKTIILPR